jgi:hypothetical protein
MYPDYSFPTFNPVLYPNETVQKKMEIDSNEETLPEIIISDESNETSLKKRNIQFLPQTSEPIQTETNPYIETDYDDTEQKNNQDFPNKRKRELPIEPEGKAQMESTPKKRKKDTPSEIETNPRKNRYGNPFINPYDTHGNPFLDNYDSFCDFLFDDNDLPLEKEDEIVPEPVVAEPVQGYNFLELIGKFNALFTDAFRKNEWNVFLEKIVNMLGEEGFELNAQIINFMINNNNQIHLVDSFLRRVEVQNPQEIRAWIKRRFNLSAKKNSQIVKENFPIKSLNQFPELIGNLNNEGMIANILPLIFRHLPKRISNCISPMFVKFYNHYGFEKTKSKTVLDRFPSLDSVFIGNSDLMIWKDNPKFCCLKKIHLTSDPIWNYIKPKESYNLILRLPNLKTFSLRFPVTCAELPDISLLKKLKNLSINITDLNPDYQQFFTKLTALKTFNVLINSFLFNPMPNNDEILILTNLKTLNIKLKDNSVEGEHEAIPNEILHFFTNLTTLHCTDRTTWNEEGLKHLTNITELKISNLTYQLPMPFHLFKKLNSLSITTDQHISFDRISCLTNLTILKLFKKSFLNGENIFPTDCGWSYLSLFTNLKELNLNSGKVGLSLDYATVSRLSKLEHLYGPVNELTVKTFKVLTNLQSINGHYFNLANEVEVNKHMVRYSAFFERFSNLENLDVSACMKFPVKKTMGQTFTQLKKLTIDMKSNKKTKISDLCSLTNLERLNFKRNLTENELALLYKSLPDTDISD